MLLERLNSMGREKKHISPQILCKEPSVPSERKHINRVEPHIFPPDMQKQLRMSGFALRKSSEDSPSAEIAGGSGEKPWISLPLADSTCCSVVVQ